MNINETLMNQLHGPGCLAVSGKGLQAYPTCLQPSAVTPYGPSGILSSQPRALWVS